MKNIEKKVKISYSPGVNSGYIALQEIPSGGVEYTFPVIVDQNGCMFNIDMDKDKKIIGIELVGMDGSLSQEIMDELNKAEDN